MPQAALEEDQRTQAFPPVDEASQALFDQGHAIAELAKTLYLGGIEVGDGLVHHASRVEESAALLNRRVPLYEPALAVETGYARIDILVPDGPESWRSVEVKSGTSVKEEKLLDAAFQIHVCRGAGLTITRCALMLVDSAYVRQGEIDASGLLVEHDVTEAVLALLPTRRKTRRRNPPERLGRERRRETTGGPPGLTARAARRGESVGMCVGFHKL